MEILIRAEISQTHNSSISKACTILNRVGSERTLNSSAVKWFDLYQTFSMLHELQSPGQ